MKKHAKTLLATAAILSTMAMTAFAGSGRYNVYSDQYCNEYNDCADYNQTCEDNVYYGCAAASEGQQGRYYGSCHNSSYNGSHCYRSYRGCR